MQTLDHQSKFVVQGVVSLELFVLQRGLELEVLYLRLARYNVPLQFLDFEVEHKLVLFQLLCPALELINVLLLLSNFGIFFAQLRLKLLVFLLQLHHVFVELLLCAVFLVIVLLERLNRLCVLVELFLVTGAVVLKLDCHVFEHVNLLGEFLLKVVVLFLRFLPYQLQGIFVLLFHLLYVSEQGLLGLPLLQEFVLELSLLFRHVVDVVAFSLVEFALAQILHLLRLADKILHSLLLIAELGCEVHI